MEYGQSLAVKIGLAGCRRSSGPPKERLAACAASRIVEAVRFTAVVAVLLEQPLSLA
jgi:hypothetical protein